MAATKTNDEAEVQASDNDKVKASAEKRRNLKNSSRRSRWAGLILFLICLVVGFLLWVGGEMKGSTSPQNGFVQPTGQSSQSRTPLSATPKPRNGSVIIIE